MYEYSDNKKNIAHTVPALYIGLEVCPVVQYGLEERSYASHIPHSSFEIYPCHLEKSGRKYV